MTQLIEKLNESDEARIRAQRDWVIGHYDDTTAYDSLEGKLRIIQVILDNKWIEPDETVKLQSLGITFGDALVQDVPELFWVAVEDEFGRDPALRWLETKTLVFPLTAISKRVEDGLEIDIRDMFSGFKDAINKAVRDSDA